MKRAKKLTALFLMVMMVVSMIPATSFAAAKQTKKYTVSVQFRYQGGKTASKTYKKTFAAGTTTSTVKVTVPVKKGYTASLAKRTGAAAKSNVTVKLNAKKTKLTYKIKKIKEAVAFKVVYKMNPAEPAETAEPVAEEPVASEYPAQTFEAGSEEDGVTVSVNAPEGALPDGTDMLVSGVTDEAVLTAVSETASGTVVKAVDISFSHNGKEIEPAKPIRVTITSDEVAQIADPVLVHVDNDLNAEVVEQVDEETADNEIVFESNAFSVYAVVASAFTANQQYVIYTGTTALAYNGNNLTTATVTVENGTVVRSSSDNIVWTATQTTQIGTNWRLYYTNGTGWQAQNRYLHRSSNTIDTGTGGNSTGGNSNNYNVTYDNYNHRLSINGRYLTYNNGTWGLTQTAANAATVYIALVGTEPASGDLTYNYYNADHSASISEAETIAEADYTTTWTNVSTLAKTIPGYQFLEARANSADGDVITQVNGRAYRQGTETSGNGHTLNSIYFIYMKDYVAGEDVIPGLNGPETEKKVTHNPDGTFTIQLDVTGVVNDVKHGANVVVVFDRTSSMSGRMSNTDRTMRINAAISAVNTMVDTLNPGDPSVEGQYDIDFALVEFDRIAEDYDFGTNGITGHTNWTKSGDALKTRVSYYEDGAHLAASGAEPGGGGTNWQAALQETAAVLENKPDADPTYVIFMTDGEPTIYIGSDSVNINRTTSDPEYTRAVPYATAIVNADYLMYDIFCSASDTTLLSSLYTASGAKSYVEAETTTAIENAFKAVAQDMIDAIGSSNYGVDDGVPSMGSFDIDTVEGVAQLSDARYYKKTADDAGFVEWADAPAATESEAGVLWDLSSVGTLEGETVYRVEFEIWPSQAAYDLIADLNNKQIYYTFAEYKAAGGDIPTEAEAIAAGKVITQEQHDQITQVNATTYTMKTNTSLSATYKLYGQTIVDDDIDYTAEAMDLPTETIAVKKLWPENMLDKYGEAIYRDEDGNAQTASEIKLTLQRAGENYLDFTVSKYGPDGDASTKDDNWSIDNIYVSNGFMTVETVDGVKVAHIKEEGHDYQIVEPPAFMYYWDLISDVYHPMVINGVPTLLVYNPDLTAEDVDNEATFAIGENKDGTPRIYVKHNNTENTLEASNYRRANLNLTKVIPEGANPDALFEYTATVEDAYSSDGKVWFSAWDPVASDYVYDFDVTGGNVQKETKDIPEGATIDEEAGTCSWEETDGEETWTNTYPIAGEGKYYTGYFYADNGEQLTMKIKAGWNVRFLNIYHGSTFSFEETGMPGNFEFDKVEAATQYAIMLESNEDWYTIETEGEGEAAVQTGKITGTITEPNNNYNVTYTNKCKPEFYIYHSGVAVDGNLETIPLTAVAADGTYNLYAKTTSGFLYGGYYLDYAGKGDYKDDGVKGTTGVAYTGMNNTWSGAQTVDGKKMKPVAGETYYIKEVPTYYLRNYYQINYVKVSGELTALYLISAVDDLNYKETGFTLTNGNETAKVVSKMTFTNDATGKSVTLKANTAFRSLGIKGTGSENNYLTYFDATKSAYFKAGSFTVLPYWITPDSITVNGISTRSVTISEMTKEGMSYSDN